MINPIILILTSAILLSVVVIYVLNRPKKPIFTGALIFLLICFVVMTWLVDSLISTFSSTRQFFDAVSFITMLSSPTYNQLEETFGIFVMIDISLFAATLISMVIETVNILRNDRRSS